MKHVYKLAAIAIVGITLISAQGVEAQPPKNKQSKHEYSQKGKKQIDYRNQDRFERYDNRSQGKGNKYGHYKGQNGRIDHYGQMEYAYGHGSHHKRHDRVGRVMVHHGRLYRIQHGVYFGTRHGGWVPVAAPVGLRVMQLPYGTRTIRTRFGPMYEFKGTFYAPASRGLGFIVTNAPRGVHRHRGSW